MNMLSIIPGAVRSRVERLAVQHLTRNGGVRSLPEPERVALAGDIASREVYEGLPEAARKQIARQVYQHYTIRDISLGDLELTVTDTDAGNPYRSYDGQVLELSRKYEGIATWGVQAAKPCVDLRAAFTIGSGIKVVGDAPEVAYIREFMEQNRLDQDMPQEWAREGELEGKALVKMFWDKKLEQVVARLLPWGEGGVGYTVNTADDDYGVIKSATYQIDKSTVTLKPEDFVYVKLSGRVHKINETPPKCATVLLEFESLHKLMDNWRKINNLFASPTPTVQCDDREQAEEVYQGLRTIRWKIGNLLVVTGRYRLVGMEGDCASLEKEGQQVLKTISMHTGIPPQFLGWPDILSNRAVAENTMELVAAATRQERLLWQGGYTEIFRNAIRKLNEFGGGSLNPEKVKAEIPEVTSVKLAELSTVWLPIYMANGISLDTFLSKIPDVDVTDEKALIEALPPLEPSTPAGE